jgi:two-component system NtrC family sensor kinase
MRQKRTFPFAGKSNSLGAKRKSAKASAMSLTRKAPTAAKKQSKSRRQDLAAALVEREAELAEVRRQQAATAEILKVIAASPTDVQPVFEAIAARANRLIGGFSTAVFRIFGDAVHMAAFTSVNAKADEALKAMFPLPRAQFPGLESISRGDSAQVTDTELDAGVRDLARLRGYRSMLFTPLLSNGAPIGIISVTREAPGAFSAHQVQLLQTFADQAVIAINNVGLFNETQEALKQQTATAEILKVIASSPSDVQPVFEAVAARARNLLDCWSALVVRFDGEQAHFGAARGALPDTEEFVRQQYPTRPEPESTLGRCLLERVAISHPNLQTGESPTLREYARTRGFRAVMSVPMLQDGQPIGAIIVTRQKAGDFVAREAALLQTFAAQAAIAIENTRLFNETKEALEQQTATADVLKVISRSAFDLQSVLDALVESAARLCEAEKGCIMQRHGDHYHWVSNFGFSAEHEAYVRTHPMAAGGHSATARVARDRRAVHIPDVLADPDYTASENQRLGDYRTILGVPLLRDGEPIGAFIMTREVVRPFNQRQIDLLQTFADQAVIAIENVRLFDEVQAKTRDLEESLQQQTATANVLKVISRSAFDLQAVLTTLAESARDLCGASFVTLSLREGDAMRLRAESGCTPEIVQFMGAHPIRAGRETFTGRVMLSGEAVHLPDVFADPEYDFGEGPRIGNYRALLAAPLLRDGQVEGVFALARPEPAPFTERQIEMVRAFADQAVIAIENSRLFEEVQARTRELVASLDDLRKAQDRLIQSEKLASLGQLTAGIAHEIKNPLNFINNYSALSRELVDELADAIKGVAVNEAAHGEADELIGAIGGNLDKIVQHGKRADSIVKNMLLHSREGSGERSTTNVNAMVEEALNLAYHGARAEKPGFNVTIVKSLDPNAGAAEVYAQEMTRVLLNLISNGFYATSKRKQSAADGAYEPTISASTRDLGPKVEIAIRDNGTGIPDEVKAKMFNPFFTTKSAGEGTGLGLSLSHDIVVKQHGGAIEVSTEPNAFTEFSIVLPRGAPGL